MTFLVLDEGDSFGINGSFDAPEKMFSINFSKAKTNLCLSFHHNGDNSFCLLVEKNICKFTASNKNKFDYFSAKQLSIKGNVYDFSVDYDAIDKFDILNILKAFFVSFFVSAIFHYF